jgi:hypothetical protein
MDIFERIMGLFWPRPPSAAPVLQSSEQVTVPIHVPVAPSASSSSVVDHIAGDPKDYRQWRLTYYYIADQNEHSGRRITPVLDKTGKMITHVEPSFFASMGLQGSGKCRDGILLNVQGMVDVRHDDYAEVWAYHQAHLSKRPPGYSGLVVRDGRVVQAQSFRVVPQSEIGGGYGKVRGIPLEPFRTVASDIGALHRHEPKWMGKGGVCPPFTRVFIKEFVGKTFPDGKGGTFVHDGWLVANDTGGGICGKHFDVFAGSPALARTVKIPGIATVWYAEITMRVPPDDQYDYGLHDV